MDERTEHIEWCKERALGELERSGVQAAMASLSSDFGKHESTNNSVMMMLCFGMSNLNEKQAKKFIEGFN